MLLLLFERQGCIWTKCSANLQISRTLTSLEFPNQANCLKRPTQQACFKTSDVVLKKYLTVSSQCWLKTKEFKLSSKKKNKRDDIPDGYSLIYDSRFPTTINFLYESLYHWITTRRVGSVILYVGAMVALVKLYGAELPEALGGRRTEWFVLDITVILYVLFAVSFWNSLLVRMYYNESSETFIAIVRKNLLQQDQISFKLKEVQACLEGPRIKLDIKGHTCYALKRKMAVCGGSRFFNKWLEKTKD